LKPDGGLEVILRNPTTSAITVPDLTLQLSPRGHDYFTWCCWSRLKLPKTALFSDEELRFVVKPHELGWCQAGNVVRDKCVLKPLTKVVASPGPYQLFIGVGKKVPASNVVPYEVHAGRDQR
jgi:hypothetical protein